MTAKKRPITFISERKYKITGHLEDGKQFSPIFTDTPQHYNIWSGTLWKHNNDGKYTRVRTYNN